MTEHTRWIASLNIVTRHTGFDIAFRLLRMVAAAGAFAQHRESRNAMRLRFEFRLIDVPAFVVALRAKLFHFMARRAIRLT